MDLSKLTRAELEAEASRAGVRDVSVLTRSQLIHAIEHPAGGAIDTAKALFRGVLGVARSLRARASDPREAPTRPLRPRSSRPPASPGAGDPHEPRTSEGDPAAGPAAPASESRGEDTQRLRTSDTPAAAPAMSRPDADTIPSEPPPSMPPIVAPSRPAATRTEPTRKLKVPGRESEAPETLPGFADDDLASMQHYRREVATTMDLGPLRDVLAQDDQDAAEQRTTATTVQIRPPRELQEALERAAARPTFDLEGEPIPTRTMARLLHEQGHQRRALAILENLDAQHPGDPEIRADLVRVRRALGRSSPEVSEASAAGEGNAPRSEVVSMVLDDRRVLLAWGLSADSLESARSFGATGVLVARVLIHAPDGADSVARAMHDKEVEPSGEWAIGPLAAGSFVTAAVGYRDGETFVSVASAPVLDVD